MRRQQILSRLGLPLFVALMAAIALLYAQAPKAAEAHSIDVCNEDIYGSTGVKVWSIIDHTYGEARIKVAPDLDTCKGLGVGKDVSDVYIDSWVSNLIDGSWNQCSYSSAGWRGAAPGWSEWWDTYNYFLMQSCTTTYTFRTEGMGIALFNDGYEKVVYAITPGHAAL